MAGTTAENAAGIGKGRVEALADGVFAIAMTLLILEIKVPDIPPGELSHLPRAILALWTKALVYVASFLVIGVFWVGHHAQLHYIRHTNRPFLWMNLVFLLLVSAVPFSAALLGRYPNEPIAAVLYCLHLSGTGFMLLGQLSYAAGPGLLFSNQVGSGFIRAARRRLLLGPSLYLIAAVFAVFSPLVSELLCLLVLAIYIRPGTVDGHWRSSKLSNT